MPAADSGALLIAESGNPMPFRSCLVGFVVYQPGVTKQQTL
jgi:hypothetical protein